VFCPVSVNPDRSLLVRDAEVLAHFSLQTVLGRIVQSAGGAPGNALAMYRQWWDANNDAAHAQTQGGPHCDDTRDGAGRAVLNGFPIDCPRQEGLLAATNPFDGGPDSYEPLALSNRFDLIPTPGGKNCGEYRIVYGKRSGQTQRFDRNLLIFEAVLPNPDPSRGAAACRPVAAFWARLSTVTNAATRAQMLRSFYFNGLPGFAPVISASHYGGRDRNSGQIRTNQFTNDRDYFGEGPKRQPWQLREYIVEATRCTSRSCVPRILPRAVKINPFGPLFAGSDAQAQDFQNDFVEHQVPLLVENDINRIAMATPARFNGGQSTSQAPTDNDYKQQALGNGSLRNAVQNKLTALGRNDLTPEDVMERATTQSCAGCHEVSHGRSLGGGLTWPSDPPFTFTHVNERQELSNALQTVFLPHRGQVLSDFVCRRRIQPLLRPDGSVEELAEPASTPAGTLGGATIE
jgi:hypothetical protein